MGTLISGTFGAVLLAAGAKFSVPFGVQFGSLVELLGVASIMVAFGLADGE
jgi:hypothetical protein